MSVPWTFAPWTTLIVLLLAAGYLRGRRGLSARFSIGRAGCFLAGLLVLWVALASPIDHFARYALSPHMLQHVLLTLVAAPLIVLGAPGVPLFRSMPRSVREILGPFLAAPAVRGGWRRLTHPLTAGILLSASNWIWHVPVLYQLAVEDPWWHLVEHACFLGSAMLLWWNVIEPPPFRSAWGPLPRVLLLLAIDLQNTVFCGILAFAGRALYPVYETTAPILGVDPVRDQEIAAGLMWFASQAIFLPFAAWLVARGLRAPRRPEPSARAPRARRDPTPLLAAWLVAPVLRSRRLRTVLRAAAFLAMSLVILDGLLGPAEAPANLAGTLPWTHARGFIVLGVILAGNLACMGCPFMAPRGLMRRWIRPTRPFPRWLRSKWLAVGLVALWLAFYEAFDLWASPWATAWVLVGYVAAILLVDAFFAGASFCKWVCPLGQLHGSLAEVAPVEVGVRNAGVCATCTTMECIRGTVPAGLPSRSAASRAATATRDAEALPSLALPQLRPAVAAIPGCELHLAQPRKRGNLDCTFCMDCAHACPHDNVTLLHRRVVRDLAEDPPRSSIGRTSRRLDLAALWGVLVFGAFANAVGMTEPVSRWLLATSARLGLETDRLLAFVLTILASTALPLGVGALAAAGSRERLARGLRGLLPVGASMWLVHFGFHLVTGFGAGWASLQRAAGDVGLFLGTPRWAAACCAEVPAWLVPAEILVLQVGGLASAAALLRSLGPRAFPWIVITAALVALGFWIVQVPMDMRGAVA